MEATEIVANTPAVIQLAAQVTQLSYSYVQHVKNAPKIQKKYLQEVSALMDALFRIEQTIGDTEFTGLLPPLDDDALVDCYKELSRLHFELQKRTSRLLRPFQDKELRLHIDMLHKFRENFSGYLSAYRVTAHATYQKVSSISTEQDRNLLLTLVPPVEIQLREKPIPCPGTGQWFLNDPVVKCWIERSSPRMLWCYGPPGVGKSFIASIVIDYLGKQRLSDALVVYFFCDFPSQTEHTAVNILRSILRQLVQAGGEKVLSTLKEFVDEFNPPQNAADITKMIAKAGSVQPIYLVLDAIDEMKVPGEVLDHCLDLSTSGIHVLVTSRNLPHIQNKMTTASQLEISGSTKDLKVYIAKRLQESDFDQELAEDDAMVDNIVSKSGNLFLLARLTLDELLDLTTIDQIKKTLKREALDLQQTFESTMQRIDRQSKVRSAMARRLISWILYAKRRLKVEEVMTAFAIDEDGLQNENMPTADILLRICVGMVVINQTDNTFGLVHTSAYEYLYTHIMPETSHFDIAQTSLRYLGLNGLLSNPCNSSKDLMARFKELKFLRYSAKHWGHHIFNQDSEKRLQSLIMALLNDQKLLNAAFKALHFRSEFEGALADEIFDSIPKNEHALHIAAYWNLSETTNIILEAGANVSIADSHKWTPLHWACSKGHLEVSRILVQKGADTNLPGIQEWTPLSWASFIGNVELVRLLLSNGADHQFRTSLGWTALHWAISGGHLSVVQELLYHHSRLTDSVLPLHKMTMAEIKSYPQGAVTPIEFAADTQDADLFGALLHHLEARTNGKQLGDARFNCVWETANFDPPMSKNPWRNPTLGEALYGVESIVPEIRRDYISSDDLLRWKALLLVSAIRDEQLSSTQMLAQSGVDFVKYSALHVAANRKDPRYVQCLLQNGADATLADRRGRTALHIAILHGFAETMTALIQGGSNVNQRMPSQDDFTVGVASADDELEGIDAPPLILAWDSVQMVRILLANGADPRLCDSSGGTALSHAFSRGDIGIIKLLLEFDTLDPDNQPLFHCLTRCNDAKCKMEELGESVRFVIDFGKTLSPPRDFLNEKMRRSSPANKSTRIKDDDITLLSMSLMERKWKLVGIFSELGGTFPSNINLAPLIKKAIQDVEPDAIALLCREGAGPPPNSVILLVESFISQRLYLKRERESILLEMFKRSLATLCSTGIDINLYGTGDEEGEDEDEEGGEEGDEGEEEEKQEDEQEEEEEEEGEEEDEQEYDFRGKRGTTALILAATAYDSRQITPSLLNHGADLYAESDQTFDPILSATLYGEEEDISLLLNHSALHLNPSHWTRFLQEAPKDKDSIIERICFCLKRAGCLDKTNAEGQTLLDLAIQQGNVDLMAAFKIEGAQGHVPDDFAVEVGAKTNAMLRNIPPLELALQNHDVAAVSKLLDGGSDPNQSIGEEAGEEEHVPMVYYAARHCQLEMLSLFLDHNAITEVADAYGWRPLHVACFRGRTDIAQALISNGAADVHASTTRWSREREKTYGLDQGAAWTGTPLHLATIRGDLELVKHLLLEQNVDIHASTGTTADDTHYPGSGPTALHIALSARGWYLFDEDRGHFRPMESLTPERLQIAQWLVDAGAMVQGVIQRYSLSEILRFEKYPKLWDALVAGDTTNEEEQAM